MAASGVIFDLDGVLADTEPLWEEGWRWCARAAGVRYRRYWTTTMQGMSSYEWGAYLGERNGRPARRVRQTVIDQVLAGIDSGRGPLLPGARALVNDVAAVVPVGLASSAARQVIGKVLAVSGLATVFTATVSSEEVERGKPAPDVYLEAVRRVGLTGPVIGVEDSSNGIRSAAAAGLYVIAIPNPKYPPAGDALALAGYVAADHADARRHALARIAEEDE